MRTAKGARRIRDGLRPGRRGARLAAAGVLVAVVMVAAVSSLGRGASSPPAPLAEPLPPSKLVSADADVHDFAGLRYSQVAAGEESPAGVLHVGDGLVVGEHWRPGQPVSHMWAETRQGSRQMLWFQQVVGQEGTTRTVQVLDAVDTGPVDDGYQLQVESCRQGNGESDPEIAAMVRYAGDEEGEQAQEQEQDRATPVKGEDGEDDGDHGKDAKFETSSDIRAAWRLDRSTGRIVTMPTAGLLCQSTGD